MMKLNLFIVFSLLGLFSVCVGQFVQEGQCDPNIPLATNFVLNEFLGDWFEIARSANPLQNGHCSSIRFSRSATSNTTVDIYGRMVSENFVQEINGTAIQVSDQAKLLVNLTGFEDPFEWSILMIDHQNFILGYSCSNLDNQRRSVHIWQIGRQTTYPNEMMAALMNITLGNLLGINASLLESVVHTDDVCRTLPVIDDGQAIILPGRCDPDIRVQQNFDVVRFLGLWHETASYYSESALGTCNRAEYSLGNNVVNVLNSQVINQILDTIDGNATVTSTDGSARLSVVLNLPGGGTNEMPLYVIATDYTQYAISYTCVDLPNNEKRVYSWILSRNRRMNESVSLLVNEVVNSIFELNNQYYRTTDQSDTGCFFYPEPVRDQAVLFRGQCNESIPALANFDPVRYMGLWHDIESYPTDFQFGSCANAFYTLVDGQVDVFNTQVVNQRLDTINGVAVIASTDGSAKLSVRFPIAGTNLTTETDYWVLNTDYVNYAIVYSCRNVNDDAMQVTSWKLSRTKTLTNASAQAINNTIQNINVLDNRYYQSMDQSTEGCFYYPDPQAGVPVVFPGQCDMSISVQANFDLVRFSGIWHEIQAYPKEEQIGQCVNHQFTVAGTGYNLVSLNVDDQFLGNSTGNVTFAGITTEGKFNINLSVDGTNIEIPYWILSTDYDNYALAYSCVNISSDFRGIWSWKLSRSKQLTAASNASINQIIENVQVLNNVYYEDIDQSDDACFYLPELPDGDPIILPGQCNTTITGIQNFDAARYLGNWRLIEGYASDSQKGTCEEANYSLGADGTVVVFNTEVINQTLVNITGSAVFARDDGSGVLNVTFPDIPGFFEYFILDTDYDSFALVYGCMNINTEQRRIWSWKMSRTNSLTQNAINRINQVVNNINVLNNRYYQVVDRSAEGCFYYPEPNVNSVVIFPGQCDETIEVVTNFNVVAYLGLWHDVERYPVAFQNGTCGNAFYSVVEAGVDVFNTQVINESLDTINGIAVLATNDGSAKLNVTFPIAGTPLNITTNYWVLSTDYNTFALVYSCSNIDGERRQVSSWKLGRAKSLSAAANAAIQLAIDRVQVLDNRYYIPQDQTPEGCFYYPEPQPGVPVVFPGQCDQTISGMSNFNMTNFQGVWHEIEAYPKDDQTGQCVNHEFTVQSNTAFNLQSSSITNATLDITNSNMIFASNDGSASFNIILNANGTTITIPYIILNTDYNNYAVAYSCVDLSADFRAVYSWKLSRTKSITTESLTAINNAIRDINVLDDVYFETIDQTDNACFYFPEVTPGQTVDFPGQCDRNIVAVQNFNAAAYLGRWKLIETYPSEFQLGECNDATYTLGANNTVNLVNTEVVSQTLNSIAGSAVVSSTDNSGVLLVNIDGAPAATEYYILDTDYTSFTIVYSCVNIGTDRRRVWGWKMSRTDNLSENATNRINAAMERVNVLDNRYFQTVNRSDEACFYFPEVNINTPLVFRGQCNESIPVVNNFNVAAYLGLWHDVERYPVAFQNGTCGNAFYSLVEEGVDVFNTQVIVETLDTINGIAILATDDGSAKLNVTFPILGTPLNITTNYWVLATDYTSYALVYSCQNLDSEYRQVSSWKLGRAKTLTATANAAMQTIINDIQVLDNRYYIPQDQTPQGCFYYPEPQPGVPVVFPGQCEDDSPSIVSNFNMAQFQGVWHEIEAYPKDDQPGDCVNHEFSSITTTTFTLQTRSVLNLTLGITNSSARFATINPSVASFFIDIPGNGSTITIPYQILSTDYNNYALAYSCMNLNNDFRAVYSWKLSRTRSLSAASVTAINNAISDVRVLDNNYFETVDQSNNACFYLPNLGPGEPVIFPGQCETNVPVMANFQPARYLGRWKLIETYPSEFQLGDCADATYSLADNGTVIVYNTEVVSETLSSIYGLATIDSNAKLIVTFPNSAPIEYYILDTDYDTYALVYSCSNLENDRRRVWAWKMSRTDELTQNAINNIQTVVNSFDVLDNRYFETVNRTAEACFYFPEPGTDPIEFRGQCDANITGMPAFDAVRYMGLWHDIESYPAPFQMGTCPNAEYTLNADGTVSVYNTQVVNQVLDVMNGTAVVASTDGSAWLRVTFNVGGQNVTTDYYVLDTDYVNYALVYSCQNISTEYRRVFSWKLSRAQNLSPASALAIQETVNRIQVLRDDYFLYRGQSESDCFYYPDNFGGDVILKGQCVPDNQVAAIANFTASNFANTWHEVARFPSGLQDGECVASNKVLTTANTFGITNTIVRDEREFTASTVGSISADGRGIINVTLSGVPFDNVYILATDYTEYALIYACRNLDAERKQIYSWKLSRSRSGLSQNATNAINAIVSDNIDLWEGYYYNTKQTDDACFHYPIFDTLPASIILPGRCNETIRGIPNFDAVAYMGRWIEIQRYPQPDQFGTCDRAEYSLNSVVNVRNTQVVNQILLTQLGQGFIASTDGSAQLDVIFEVNGVTVTANYYVLATDYVNYALVYSCRNLDSGNRQVGSWKLSRTTSLNNQANNAMNVAIANTQGLIQEYYLTTSQSDVDCFYIPAVNQTEAPVFRGQCENVSGVQNFNVQRYLGWWHEIERFPINSNAGECRSSRYEQSGNQFLVTDTNVSGGNGQVTTGSVQASSNGVLTRTLSDGTVEEIVVLATDYESYALLYSCVNIDSEHRRVWSAKHSKTRQLTDAAQNAMTPYIESNSVLYPQFYLDVNQTDSSCFHYPNQTGQQVILPGQCDLDIPVVQNFDAAEYGGTWYQIERYPQIHETGNCTGARYTLDANTGIVDVLNWEVVSGVLETINGTATVVSSDGSAKLSVILPIRGTNETVETSLYVLTTDYNTYSLAYSCVNVNNYERQIGAWKLSRERTMPTAGASAIDNYMRERQELHQPYFIQVPQSEDCEEPSSAFLFKSSIVVLLVCTILQMLL
ncbi:hypothetical protein K1T71_010658 [Dendrolimus kikuchii]|uniref:Uncharacterized protein n=1 Tax=Dendrolimus kikuchii TaxID=765133 RepID=A0ACC1CPH1_9NEOP|nr:hypothetical protein K1T71_010658 [Dendrolimus kikuchii]